MSSSPASNLFSSAPVVWSIGQRLYARAPLFWRAISLFSYDRLLMVDRAREEVVLRSQWLWRLRREKRIPFSRVNYIDLDYSSIAFDSNRGHQSTEFLQKYKVSLALKKPPETVELFRFSGDAFSVRDDSGFSISGLARIGLGLDSTEDRSKQEASGFVARLADMIQVPVGPRVTHYAMADGTKFFCSECGRRSGPGRDNCLYCGGALDAVIAAEKEEA